MTAPSPLQQVQQQQQGQSAFSPQPAPNAPTHFHGGAQPSRTQAVPEQQGPDSAEQPQAQPQPQAPQQPQIDPRQLQMMQQKAQQLDQLQATIQEQYRLQQMRDQENQARTQFTSQREQIYRTAQSLPPEDAFAYVRQHEDQITANMLGTITQIRQQAEQEKYQAVAQVAAPLYGQQLAAQIGLPPGSEYAQRLQMLPPHLMDQYAPVIKREYDAAVAQQQQYAELQARLDQYERSQDANQMANSGVHQLSGAGGTPINDGANAQELDRASLDYLATLIPLDRIR
jgi:hypothetical protein